MGPVAVSPTAKRARALATLTDPGLERDSLSGLLEVRRPNPEVAGVDHREIARVNQLLPIAT